ncbi:MAG: response regulator [Brevundimonas sp.]|nr:MAG: response regulator [Brevundimonas sp.]
MTSILIVEDDENIRELSDYILSQAGYQVFKANNGRDALDMMRQQRFNLILLDVHMPIMSGLDVLRSVARPGVPMLPVLMVTANRNIDTVNEAMLLGCVGYVVKPFTPEGLLDRTPSADRKAQEPRRVRRGQP